MKNHVELMASYWTISGAFPLAAREYSPFDFKDRVEAAARAGFKGLGLWHADLDHILERSSRARWRNLRGRRSHNFTGAEAHPHCR